MKKLLVGFVALLTLTAGVFAGPKFNSSNLKSENTIADLAKKLGLELIEDVTDPDDGENRKLYMQDEDNWIYTYSKGDKSKKDELYFYTLVNIDGKIDSNFTYKSPIETSHQFLTASIKEDSKIISSVSVDINGAYVDWKDSEAIFMWMCRYRTFLYFDCFVTFQNEGIVIDDNMNNKYYYYIEWFDKNKDASPKDFIKENNQYLKEHKL